MKFDKKRMVFILETCDEQHIIPAVYEVCGRCDGKGVHDHPAFNGFTQSEWNERCLDDEDWPERYFSGEFDVTCTVCDGERVVPTPDYDSITEAAAKALETHDKLQAIDDYEQALIARGVQI